MMSAKSMLVSLFIPLLAASTPVPSSADWTENGVPLCDVAGSRDRSYITCGQSGGAIIVWDDERDTAPGLYAQAVDNNGNLLWSSGGVPLCLTTGTKVFMEMTPDGSGGAIVTWHDYRAGSEADIYVQSLNASGAVRWTAGGVALCTAVRDQWYPKIVGDGTGGAIAAWVDYRNLTGDWSSDIFAQSVDAGGAIRWAADGIPICTAPGEQMAVTAVTDGGAGMILAWTDYRPYFLPDQEDNYIYVQAIDTSGVVQWTADGIAICSASGRRGDPEITSDGAGGAIVTWMDNRDGDYDIYAQAINQNGVAKWTPDGVPICTFWFDQGEPRITPDGAGGAIITWYDRRWGNYDVYAQAVDSAGAVKWTTDGIPVCTETGDQWSAWIVSDGAGGAILSWTDTRSGDYNVYAQAIDAEGAVAFEENGRAVATAGVTDYVAYLAADGDGGAIITWGDYRGTEPNVYAMRVGGVTTDATVPAPAGRLSLSQNYPNPFNPVTTVRFTITEPAGVRLELFDVSGRLIKTLTAREHPAGTYEYRWTGIDDEGRSASSGIYFCRLTAGDDVQTRKMVLLR